MPGGVPYDDPLVVDRFWILSFDDCLWHLVVVGNKYSVLVLLTFWDIKVFTEQLELLKS
jgi:hypothetical protein